MHTEGQWRQGHREKVAVFKQRREASGKTNPADTLALDFQPPEQEEIHFWCLSHSGMWDFVRAA